MITRPLLAGPLDRMLYLRTLPALERLPPPLLGAIAQHSRERQYTTGGVLLDATRPAEAVHVVVEGRVEVERERMPRSECGPNETVGLLPLLARLDRGMHARALVDTRTLELDWDAHMDVCEQHFQILYEYLRYLSLRLLDEAQRLPDQTSFGTDRSLEHGADLTFDLVRRVLLIGQVHTLSTTGLDALVELARHVTEVRVGEGDCLWNIGAPANDFLLITAGKIRCRLPDGRTHFSCATQAFGVEEALAGVPRRCDAVANEPVTAMQIHRESFLDILEDHFELAVDVTSKLAARLLEL